MKKEKKKKCYDSYDDYNNNYDDDCTPKHKYIKGEKSEQGNNRLITLIYNAFYVFRNNNGSPNTTLTIGSNPNSISIRTFKITNNYPESIKLYTNLPHYYTSQIKPFVIIHFFNRKL